MALQPGAVGTFAVGTQPVSASIPIEVNLELTGSTISVNPGSITTAVEINPNAVVVTVGAGMIALEGELDLASATVSVSPQSFTITVFAEPTAPAVTVTPGTIAISRTVDPDPVAVNAAPGSIGIDLGFTLGSSNVSTNPGSFSIGVNVDPDGADVTVTPGTAIGSFSNTLTGVTVVAGPGSATIIPGPVNIDPEPVIVSVDAHNPLRILRLTDVDVENTDISVYDATVTNGTLTAYASVHFEGMLIDPDYILFCIRPFTVARSGRTEFTGDLTDGKVTKIQDGIYRYVEDVSNLPDARYKIDCKAVFPERIQT